LTPLDATRYLAEVLTDKGRALVALAPQLFLAGIIDKTGRFKKDLDTPRLRETDGQMEFVIAWANETSIGQDVVICQNDVRAIQLAKAAMYAGSKILMKTLGVEKLDKVILAGAFGSYIDKQSAAMLGLFPDVPPDKVYSVGNAAGDGARMALLDIDKRTEANHYARRVDYIELTLVPEFEKAAFDGEKGNLLGPIKTKFGCHIIKVLDRK
jgi:uncharacterized 2Fe-2S/4Fe-4S cluster protein (DUF4445 family)